MNENTEQETEFLTIEEAKRLLKNGHAVQFKVDQYADPLNWPANAWELVFDLRVFADCYSMYRTRFRRGPEDLKATINDAALTVTYSKRGVKDEDLQKLFETGEKLLAEPGNYPFKAWQDAMQYALTVLKDVAAERDELKFRMEGLEK